LNYTFSIIFFLEEGPWIFILLICKKKKKKYGGFGRAPRGGMVFFL